MLYKTIGIDKTLFSPCPSSSRKRGSILNLKSTWIPACAPQGHSDLLSAKALAKSYAGMTNKKEVAING
jgi:hypothetical protein